jgi:PAS domain S-box-containing protein
VPAHKAVRLPLEGQTWELRAQALPEYLSVHQDRSATYVALGGLLISFSLFALLRTTTQAEARAQDLVALRTHELSEALARLRGITDTISEGVHVTDETGAIRFANPGFERMLGWAPSEVLGQNAHLLAHGRDQDGKVLPLEDCPLHQANATASHVRVETVFWHRDGHPVQVAVHSAPLADGGAVVSIRDITERKQAEEALRQAQKMEGLGLMAGGIAHDFNNLFQALKSNLELAVHCAKDERTLGALHRANDVLDRASGLTLRILEFTGKSLRQTVPTDLNALVRTAIGGVAHPEGLLEQRLDSALPPVVCDAAQIQHVVSVLLANALEAGEAKPQRLVVATGAVPLVTPQAKHTGTWVQPPPEGAVAWLRVQDQGCGMSREVIARIFDPFFSTKAPGRGLGLPALLGILKAHHAGLQVESQEGEGSCFTIYLPL